MGDLVAGAFPNQFVQELQAKIRAERARRSGSRSFEAFVEQAWEFCPQVEPLEMAWHMRALCAHYEAVARGEIPWLLVNCPPGHAKSVVLAVLWPAWIWSWWPQCQMLFCSYAESLAMRDSLRCRTIIESDWYRKTYSGPAGWTLARDQNAKGWFMNTLGGERRITSIGGAGAGLRAHVIGVDDPLNIKDAHSESARTAASDYIRDTLSQRWVDARTPRFAMVMQRLHSLDPTGVMVKQGGCELLVLPGAFSPKRRAVTYHFVRQPDGSRVRREFWRDPREREGDLLFPERFPREVLEAAKAKLGAFGYASQIQQEPAPAAGGLFPRASWRWWRHPGRPANSGARPEDCSSAPAVELPGFFDDVVLSVDANYKPKAGADPVSILCVAAHGANRYILHRANGPFGFTQSLAEIRLALAHVQSTFNIHPRKILVELAANGQAIVEALSAELEGVVGVPPGGSSKESRAWAVQPQVEAGNCFLPDGAAWCGDFVHELAVFPNGEHDDDVDAFSQALLDLSFSQEQGAMLWLRGVRG